MAYSKVIFETEVCSRCGGSGNYSYCQMYGTTCFKCGGKGKNLTKRGAATAAFFRTLCSKMARDIKVGDEIWMDNIFGKSFWMKIESITGNKFNAGCKTEGERVTLIGSKCSNGVFEKTPIRVRQNETEHAAKYAASLEYQASLTQAGKIRKNPAKAAATPVGIWKTERKVDVRKSNQLRPTSPGAVQPARHCAP